ncbi:MAG: hypothetical protein J6D04_03265, partial [Clostridia bacterium]|nr:hypothetical protein [Clostridia bacterium]
MLHVWWNRKKRSDRSRLRRMEAAQTETLSALDSLSHAQQALDGLLTSHTTLLSEHTSLLSDLTEVAEALQEEVQALTALYGDLGSELLVMENNDSALSARLDGIEEACADTAAEQATRLDRIEKALFGAEGGR